MSSVHPAEEKVLLAQQLAQAITRNPTKARDLRRDIDGAIRLMVSDVESEVRRAFLANLKHYPGLPADVIDTVLKDVTDIPLPFIEFADVLREKDLIHIIHEADDAELQKAVARRHDVSANISAALVDHALDDEVVVTLLENEKATIADDTVERIASTCENKAIATALVKRESVSLDVINKMMELVGDALRAHVSETLQSKYGLAASQIAAMVTHAHHLALLDRLDNTQPIEEIHTLVDSLIAGEEMDPALIMSALYMGKYNFAIVSIASLAHDRPARIESLLKAMNMPEEFEEIIDKADLPTSFAGDFFSILKYCQEVYREQNIPSKEFMQKLYRHLLDYPEKFPSHVYLVRVLKTHPFMD